MIALLILAALITVVILVVALQPTTFEIKRSTTISVTPELLFPHVNTLRNWETWSPWAKLDPNATITYEGTDAGPGASYRWAGNNRVGARRMTIKESKPNERVLMDLSFTAPMKANNVTEFVFKPSTGQTQVTWSMRGHNAFMAKAFGLFVNVDKMVGKDFEKGLAQLKSQAEAGGK